MVPNLGIVNYRDGRSFVMADIPGIIEDACQGKGLGLRFLRHIERNAVLLFLIPADSEDINKEFNILMNEIATFNPELLDKPMLLGISKSDMLDEEMKGLIAETIKVDIPYLFFSAVAQKGLDELKDKLWTLMNK